MDKRTATFFLVAMLAVFCTQVPGWGADMPERYVMPTVTGPLPDAIRLGQPSGLENRILAGLGLVDVTVAPFFADPSGRRDSTKALQRAIDYARDKQMVCFLPSGTYRISDTLSCVQPLYMRTSGKARDARNFPCVLVGSRKGERPLILLAPDAPGFGDPRHPKYVVHFWARSEKDAQRPQPNISMNQMLVNIDITVGRGNAGAVAVRHRAAQGSGIQDCTIDVTHGLTGIEGGAGSGGSHAGITVIGGEFGLDLRETQPAPSLVGVTLLGQRQRAILYAGRQCLSAVGLRIESDGPGPVIETRPVGGNPHHGQMTLVHSTIVMRRPGGTAIRAGSSLYLEDVAVRGAKVAVAGPGDEVLVRGGVAGEVRIGRFAQGLDPRPWKGFRYTAPVIVDGLPWSGPLFEEGLLDPPGPEAQLWPRDFPSFESPGAVNVKKAPFAARGDGAADDTAALQAAINAADIVFVPKGIYRISRPLELRPGTKLVGVAKHLSLIMPVPGAQAFADASAPSPLLRTAEDGDAATVLAFLGLYTPLEMAGAYSLHWRCGGESVLRDVSFEASLPLKGFKRPGPPSVREHPLVLVDGHGAGRWYNFFQESFSHHGPGYRHLLIRNTTGPLRIYQCNPEHGRGEANMEIVGSSNVSVFGLKGEGNYPVLRIRDSRAVSVFGYGGNAAALEEKSLFEIVGSSGVVLAGLVDSPRLEGDGRAESPWGKGMAPAAWRMVLEYDVQGKRLGGSAAMARPAVYIRTRRP